MGGLPWIRKYSPTNSGEVIGQDLSILKSFILNYNKNQKKKSMLIYGPSGCGKTLSVYALADELDLEIIEMNASDYRTRDQINNIAGGASKQKSLFGKQKIILIDELDGIAGRQDYGGIAALAAVIKESAFPIMITANNPYDSKFAKIRNKSELVQFKALETNDIFEILKRIADKEKIKYSSRGLKILARRNAGDARAAINDLQILTANKCLEKKAIDELSERNRTDNMLNALVKIFKSTDINIAASAFDNVEEDFDQRFLWLDENLPKEYTKPKDLARAYDKLSKADVYRGRIRRWQHWRFLSYINNLLTAGIAMSKDKKNKEFVRYKPTGRILKLWWAKQKNMKKKAIAEKIAKRTHTNTKEMIKNIDYLKIMFKNKDFANKLIKELDLNREEVEWLIN